MRKICEICGKEYEGDRRRVTCGDPDCKRLNREAYQLGYQAVLRATPYGREYHREKMREYRAKYGYTYGQKKFQKQPKKDTIEGLGYEDRQKEETLAMVGRVEA